MEHLHTWRGTYFGYRDGDELWAFKGKHVGRFHGDEIYGSDGRYLGEVRSGKLITKRTKKHRRKGSFMHRMNRTGRIKRVNHVGRVMLAGYEDFPSDL